MFINVAKSSSNRMHIGELSLSKYLKMYLFSRVPHDVTFTYYFWTVRNANYFHFYDFRHRKQFEPCRTFSFSLIELTRLLIEEVINFYKQTWFYNVFFLFFGTFITNCNLQCKWNDEKLILNYLKFRLVLS